jgi:hypothetical protein
VKQALILGCSDRKRGFSGPAVLVYDGPLWRVVRKSLPRVELFALSALHGLIKADRRIEPYDLTIAQTRLTIPQLGNQWLDLGLNRYVNVYGCMSPAYAELLEKVRHQYGARPIFGIGSGLPIGKQSQALKVWCRIKQGDIPNWIGLCLNDG